MTLAEFFTRAALSANADMLRALAAGQWTEARALARHATQLALCAQAARECDALLPAAVPPSTQGGA